MNKYVVYVAEATIAAIVFTWVLMRPDAMVKIVQAGADAAVGSVHALNSPPGGGK